MLDECLALLAPQSGETIVDGTLGNAGHALKILESLGPSGHLLGIDRDARMVTRARARLTGLPATVCHGNFSELDKHLASQAITGVDGILLDLGVASPQIDEGECGFSYRVDGPLDMRMSADEGPTAAEWINTAPEKEIADVLYQYGDERRSRRIAKSIVNRRQQARIRGTGELSDLICRSVPGGNRRRMHPARRSFQAIRIYLNREIEHLERFLKHLPEWLNPNGRCIIISYHSLEDRPVKQAFLAGAQEGLYERLTRKPHRPTDAEVELNPRSRSAKVRAIRRLEGVA
jgi:16S rRNA (cytosine1402-N4)-methyltransferase